MVLERKTGFEPVTLSWQDLPVRWAVLDSEDIGMADRTLKVGFIGCGRISRALYTDVYTGLCDVAQVVAVADVVPELAQSRAAAMSEGYQAEAHRQQALAHNARSEADRQRALEAAADAAAAASNTIRVYENHERLLADDEVEAVVVLTAPPVRGVPAVAAAQSGRHVFTEGPMAKSVKEADEIVTAVEAAGVKYLSQCGGRYTRGMEHARRALASGLLGPLAKASVAVTWYHPASYWGEHGWPGRFETDGGGVVLHHGRYVIDPFLSVTNAPIVEVASSYSGPFLRDIEVDSYSLALVRYADGAVGTVEASLLHHEHPNWTTLGGGRMEFIGENASMLLLHRHPQPNVPALLMGTRHSMTESTVTFGSSNTPGVVEQLEALADDLGDLSESPSQLDQSRLWVTASLEDKPLPVPISVPRAHVELSRAIYKSQEIGASVALPLDTNDPYYTFEGRLSRPSWMPVEPSE